jgi:adenosylmethionine-8-amino-7-oxononanoate aminotransferase
VRPVGTKIILSPPLVFTKEHVDALVAALDAGFSKVG